MKYFKLILIIIFLFAVSFKIVAQLEYRSVLSGKCRMSLPKDFKLMDSRTLASKYARNNTKPTEVYTNGAASVNVTFNMTSQTLTEINLPSYGQSSAKQISVLKGVRLIKKEIKAINGKKIAIIEFYSSAIDGDIYNLMFIASVNGKAMLGSFNCISKDLPQWQSAAYEIVNSIKIN